MEEAMHHHLGIAPHILHELPQLEFRIPCLPEDFPPDKFHEVKHRLRERRTP